VSWIPLAGYTFAFAFAVVAYSKVGHWPYYSHPDPKELQLPLFHRTALLGVLLAHVGMLVGMLALVFSYRRWKTWQIAVFSLGCALWVLEVFRSEHVFTWLID
jgi:hypothetical protein